MPLSSLHVAARAWAEAGFYIFPCVPNGKTPGVENGHLRATTDLAQIDAWWNSNPNFNIGIVPDRSGMYVVDVDPPLGSESLAALEASHGALPPTLTIRTPRGGLHYWFEGSVPSTVQKLGPKLDTRGRGGYVLAPPSTVNGNPYVTEADIEIAVGPNWIAAEIDRAREEHAAATNVALDQPGNVARARRLLSDYIARGHLAIEGSGGDNRTYQVACEVLNFGLSPAVAFEVLKDWNNHCTPPWDEEELASKVRNAAEYSQNDAGAWATGAPEEIFASVAKQLAASGLGTQSAVSKFYPRDESEQDALPDPTWLLPDLIPDEAIVLLYGPSGGYKSFLALDMALSVAAGSKAYGRDECVGTPVIYFAAEGARSVVRKRRPAWKLARGVVEPLPFFAVDTVPLVARPEEVIAACEAIKARGIKPRLVVVDTLARSMAGLNENDAKDAGILVEAVECIKRTFACAVLVLHHTGKEEGRGARGSSAIHAGFDAVIEVDAHKASKCVQMRVRKQKDADEAETPLFFQGVQVGPSLVFNPIDAKAYEAATQSDKIDRKKVGAALRDLKAIGADNAVTTRILAVHLAPNHDEGLANLIEKVLRKLSDSVLEAYFEGGVWFLPAQ